MPPDRSSRQHQLICAQFPVPLYLALKELAARRYVSLSDVLREACASALEHDTDESVPRSVGMPAERDVLTPAQEKFVRTMVNAIVEDIIELGLATSTAHPDTSPADIEQHDEGGAAPTGAVPVPEGQDEAASSLQQAVAAGIASAILRLIIDIARAGLGGTFIRLTHWGIA